VAGHKLSDSVLERLPTLTTMNPGRKISYSEVLAFHNSERIVERALEILLMVQSSEVLLSLARSRSPLTRAEMDAVERIITHAVQKSKDGRIDVTDFMNEAASSMRYVTFTPMEVSHCMCRGGRA
jgi:solute carrier family 25 aspartate/glutamate transporter 12/13